MDLLVGETNFRNSTLLRLINAGQMPASCKQYIRWIYSKGVKLPALRPAVRRMNGYVATTCRKSEPLLATAHDSAAVCGTAVTGCPVAAVNNALSLIAGACMAALGIIAVLVAAIWGMHQKTQRLEDNNQVLVRERDEARQVLANQQHTLQLISQISEAATNEKQQNIQHSEEQQSVVRLLLAAVPAASVPVPDDVADRVRRAVCEIRACEAYADPR